MNRENMEICKYGNGKVLATLIVGMLSYFHTFTFSHCAVYAASSEHATFVLRAASYNIRTGNDSSSEQDADNNWANRKADLSNLVKDISPDVIGFQEVQYGQLTYLKNQLSDYEFVDAFRNGGTSGEATPVAFLTRRFELLRSGTFWLSATPDVVGSTMWGGGIEDSGCPRICTWVLLGDKSSGGVVLFACTHLDLKAGPRLAGMRLILSRLSQFVALDVPIVIVGDMNALETEDSIVEATQSMRDSLLASMTPPTGSWRTYTGFNWTDDEISCAAALVGYTAGERTANSAVLGKRIDYIFSSSNTVVETFAIRNDARPNKNYYPSDHYPVVADLSVPCMDKLNMHSWISESAATECLTGTWAQDVTYGLDGRAYLYNDVFTPYAASTGNVVTVEAKISFYEDESDYTPDADTQAAVRLSTNGCFQVWTKELKVESGKLKVADESIWIDVAAEGVTPVSGAEYTLRTTLDYTAQTYSVAVLTGNADGPAILSRQDGGSPSHSFPLASSANCVTSFAFVGDTYFTSLVGECRYEAIGFRPGEITVADANVILDAAKVAWLNARGDYAAVSNRLATVTSNEFATAWLCNLDIMNADASAKLSITRIDVGSDSVAVGVTLERIGAVAQKINGVLKFYGATALAAFREGTAAPLASTTLVDDDFSEGDATTATFSKDGNTFFKAEIEE